LGSWRRRQRLPRCDDGRYKTHVPLKRSSRAWYVHLH
jgi:hypothetical protein